MSYDRYRQVGAKDEETQLDWDHSWRLQQTRTPVGRDGVFALNRRLRPPSPADALIRQVNLRFSRPTLAIEVRSGREPDPFDELLCSRVEGAVASPFQYGPFQSESSRVATLVELENLNGWKIGDAGVISGLPLQS